MPALSDSRIILVHGRGSKPAKETLQELWVAALLASIAKDSAPLATAMRRAPDLFRTAYWANAVPDHIEDGPAEVRRQRRALDAVIAERRRAGAALHITAEGWVAGQVRRFGSGVVAALAAALTIKDDVIREHMQEVRLYSEDQYIADRIRGPLESELRAAWDDRREPVLIAHSMGTFIAYDVLWRFSHRSEPQYRRYRRRKVGLLATLGSPLGDGTLRSFMLIDRWARARTAPVKAVRRRYYPANIARWYNFSAYGDIVCHDAMLEDDFFVGLRHEIGGYRACDLRDYVKLYNPYRDAAGRPNAHKSYGYLIQPKLSQRLIGFFGD